MSKSSKEVRLLENLDTDLIQRQGWKLDKMFEEDVNKAEETYNKAMKYAEILSAQCKVALRTVTHKESVFMEVYKKDD